MSPDQEKKTERAETRRIAHLYHWVGNEDVLLVRPLVVGFLFCFYAVIWPLHLLARRTRLGRWAADVLDRLRAQRQLTGSWTHPSRRFAWHHRQVFRFQALYLAMGLATCGLGLLLGAPFYVITFKRARQELLDGGWPLLPIVGRWQPEPPVAVADERAPPPIQTKE